MADNLQAPLEKLRIADPDTFGRIKGRLVHISPSPGEASLDLLAEATIWGLSKEPGLGAAVAEVWHGRDRNNILATVLCIGAAFAAYNLLSAVNRRLAGGRLGAWLLGRSPEIENR